MKLFRFGNLDKERPGVEFKDGTRIDVTGFTKDFDEDFFSGDGVTKLEKWLSSNEESCPKISARKAATRNLFSSNNFEVP